MKKSIAYSFFLFTTLIFAYKSYASAEPWIEKKKVITKTYQLSANQKVSITNTFGGVNVQSWERNEVKVEVTIKVSSNNERMAQEILDQIWIDDHSGREISFETHIGANGSNSNRVKTKNTDSKMEINYEVQLPRNTPLFVKNSFGKTYIPSRNGETELEQSFGDLSIGSLPNLDRVTVEFGKLNAERLENSKGIFKFSDIRIDNLAGSIKSNFEFCKKPFLAFSKDLEEIKIDNSYSDISIDLPEAFNGTFDIKTSFCELKNKSAIQLNEQKKENKHDPKFDKSYDGKTGTGKTRVTIKSSFGNITFN